jgi:hypothetical protein
MKLLQAVAVLGILMVIAACGSGSHPQQAQQTMIQPPTVALTQLSTDTFTNAGSQHATEVEASAGASGSTIVSAFQVGRIFSGGASDIGFATSTNSGASWVSNFLPGITIYKQGTFSAASDPVVAFDAAHGIWIISSLTIANADQVVVNRSPDGINWDNPIMVSATPSSDKNWITCDNTPTSPFFGHCYLEWDDPSTRNLIWMSTSTDGGLTWVPAHNTADLATGVGGQPVVQPNGTVIVPIENATGAAMLAFTSTNGGASWSASTTISAITDHLVAGNLRTSALPSAAVDAAGTVYAIWQDCRFRMGCFRQRPGNEHVNRWQHLDRPRPHSDRPAHQHRRSLHSRLSHRTRNFGQYRASRPHILFLRIRQLRRLHLRTVRRIHFFTRWRQHLDRSHHSRRTDVARLAAQHLRRIDGR